MPFKKQLTEVEKAEAMQLLLTSLHNDMRIVSSAFGNGDPALGATALRMLAEHVGSVLEFACAVWTVEIATGILGNQEELINRLDQAIEDLDEHKAPERMLDILGITQEELESY